jgi:hypothetical protein
MAITETPTGGRRLRSLLRVPKGTAVVYRGDVVGWTTLSSGQTELAVDDETALAVIDSATFTVGTCRPRLGGKALAEQSAVIMADRADDTAPAEPADPDAELNAVIEGWDLAAREQETALRQALHLRHRAPSRGVPEGDGWESALHAIHGKTNDPSWVK